MTKYQDIDVHMANLDIEEENESFVFDTDIKEYINRHELCLAGRFLTKK